MSSRAISGGVAHTVPVDLRRVLIANPKVLAAWEDLTPLARNEWICCVLWPKKAETRSQHIKRLQSELLEGKLSRDMKNSPPSDTKYSPLA